MLRREERREAAQAEQGGHWGSRRRTHLLHSVVVLDVALVVLGLEAIETLCDLVALLVQLLQHFLYRGGGTGEGGVFRNHAAQPLSYKEDQSRAAAVPGRMHSRGGKATRGGGGGGVMERREEEVRGWGGDKEGMEAREKGDRKRGQGVGAGTVGGEEETLREAEGGGGHGA